MKYNECKSLFLKYVNQLSRSQHVYKTFEDFCFFASIAIRNSVDLNNREEREEDYLKKEASYSVDNMTLFKNLFGLTVQALSQRRSDFLGEVYMELDIGNKDAGQFFTPNSVSELMGGILLTNDSEGNLYKKMQEKGFITIQEPTIGAGGMIIAAVHHLYMQGINYQKRVHVTGIDIDLSVLRMAYIQLSLLGVPAKLIHGDTLALKEYDVWYTPMHIMFGWSRKLR